MSRVNYSFCILKVLYETLVDLILMTNASNFGFLGTTKLIFIMYYNNYLSWCSVMINLGCKGVVLVVCVTIQWCLAGPVNGEMIPNFTRLSLVSSQYIKIKYYN